MVLLDLICKENGILSNGHLIAKVGLDDCCWASLSVAESPRRAASRLDSVAIAG